ncbi:MAG: ABC transporter ATP-binding protein, partial [Betaproteobacteria bacterium]|nr:ABC transporter ATP-binding protein [Betaproteobacteria bacterium]
MLEIDGLTAGYGGAPVLKGVNIRVPEGELTAIVGPNGAGKTTLFKTISGIISPTGGSIRLQGSDLLAVRPCDRPHHGIAHVPEGRQVFPSLSVRENLEMGAYTPAGRKAFQENLERIYSWFPVLKERAESLAGALSGGQQQMLAIGRGIASSPKLLMLDEPSMGLSPSVADEIFERIVAIHQAG